MGTNNKRIERPIINLHVKFNNKMWEVIEINKEENFIILKSVHDNKKVITRKLDNEKITYYTI